MLTDEEIVSKALSEDIHHYGLLVERYADYLFGLGMRLTSGDSSLSKDIAQQTFLNSFTYLKSFNTKKKYKPWLTGIAINCFKDLRRDQREFANEVDANELQSGPDAEDFSEFYRLIKPLSDEERPLFVLKYIYGFKDNEIATISDQKVGTVKSKLSRALEKLR